MLAVVGSDGLLEVCDGVEHVASDAPSGDDGQEIFDGVDPRGRGWPEMEDPARMIGQPLEDFGALMGGVVVGDGLDDHTCCHGALDGAKTLDEFLMRVPGHTPAHDGSIEDIECRVVVPWRL
jgi:hypothetical protein